MTSHLLYKTRCPACAENGKDRSGDNLGVYSDGHTYCYSCGYSSSPNVAGKLSGKTKEHKPIPDLPEDTDVNLSIEAKRWLYQYFNEKKDFPQCFWSISEKKLIFPIYDKQNKQLLAWQYRYFGDNKDHPKWVGYGITDNLIHISSPSNRNGSTSGDIHHNNEANAGLVLVEDIISGMKVGHILPTLTLFGSNISLKRLATLKLLGYNEVIIWLDWDKKEYSIKAAQLAQSIGLSTRVIHTKLDPKEYSTGQIKDILYYDKGL